MPNEDAQLIRRFLRGDRAAVRRIEGWIQRAAFSYRRRLGDDWEDLCQDLCIELISILRDDRFGGHARLQTFVWKVVNNACVDRMRSRGRWGWIGLDDAQATLDRLGLEGARHSERLASRELAEAVSNQVPALCRQLWAMILQGFSYAEMGRRLGVVPATLRVRVLRCRKKALVIRAELEKEDSV